MLIFATCNEDKLKEIKKIIPECVSMKEAGFYEDIVEDGTTYEQNAVKKAKTVMLASGYATLSDDSGIEIDFFDKKPGVDTANFLFSNKEYKERNKKILELMKNCTNRYAIYVCTICLFLPSGEYFFTTGTLEGEIATTPAGTNGFAYDEIFYIPKLKKTLAQISLNEKNKISHRNEALQKMKIIINDSFLENGSKKVQIKQIKPV
ncbi:MAG: RdgB/HAM1 family non-canonical purine NTP pyrophosphatase [Defluviitaleaceae bacterium]|nr:RdgB/HAM1 family non-canonical purine NTP pyrophosphatase [Defluviitaleaceae bacterium]